MTLSLRDALDRVKSDPGSAIRDFRTPTRDDRDSDPEEDDS